ncbi:hypothetical protein SAY86_009408 [Trapa natans]|uniref:Wound-induced protein 1 n=1 Tax=Trapa natans TaxID=22666 RepID=A0AAN7L1L3_TRANT|nr:hypothetical protein SAY86_009408 [Trapa natans]
MRLLTGSPSAAVDTFQFVPHSVTSFGSTVLSEGCDPTGSITWVHAWTVSDGIITQVSEANLVSSHRRHRCYGLRFENLI